mmetsp:Transcript_17381/g.36017  ORF Transcript_17381/g.36017 Transcript_17381/m.36017 type:complete len:200 (-) Transcript_17381:1355-1954(-)
MGQITGHHAIFFFCIFAIQPQEEEKPTLVGFIPVYPSIRFHWEGICRSKQLQPRHQPQSYHSPELGRISSQVITTTANDYALGHLWDSHHLATGHVESDSGQFATANALGRVERDCGRGCPSGSCHVPGRTSPTNTTISRRCTHSIPTRQNRNIGSWIVTKRSWSRPQSGDATHFGHKIIFFCQQSSSYSYSSLDCLCG